MKAHGSRLLSDSAGSLARMDRRSRLVFLAPIVAAELYLNATLVLFVSGFWPWPVERWTPIVSFLIAAHCCLLAGFLLGSRVEPGRPAGDALTRRVLYAVIVVNVLLLVPTTISRTGQPVPDLASAWRDYGSVYLASIALRASRTHVVEYVRVCVGYLIFPLVPLVVFYWPDMSRATRAVGAFAIAWLLALGFAMGINKPVAELAVMVIVFAAARWFSVLGPTSRGGRQFNYVYAGVAAVLVLALGVSFYRSQTERLGQTKNPTGFTIGSRVPDRYVRPQEQMSPHLARGQSFPSTKVYARRDLPLVRDLPLPMVVFLERGALYLTQGYYALALALNLPWQPTWGVGHSFFTFENAKARFPGMQQQPYPMRLEAFGWDAYRSWSSFYTWAASDVSFGGTLVLMLVIGVGAGVSWRDTLAATSPFAVAAFGCFLIVILYLPANNQMLQFGEGWTATWGILTAWLLTRGGRFIGRHRTSPSARL